MARSVMPISAPQAASRRRYWPRAYAAARSPADPGRQPMPLLEPSGANTPTSPACTQPSPKLSTDKNAEPAKYSRATAHADVSAAADHNNATGSLGYVLRSLIRGDVIAALHCSLIIQYIPSDHGKDQSTESCALFEFHQDHY